MMLKFSTASPLRRLCPAWKNVIVPDPGPAIRADPISSADVAFELVNDELLLRDGLFNHIAD